MKHNLPHPELLIVANEELAYGISHGYYPEFTKAIQNGNLVVYPIGSVQELRLSKNPVGDGTDFYCWNPSGDNYLSLCDNDLMTTLISDKSFALKEVFVRMGAKDVVLIEETGEKESTNTKLQNKSDFKLVNADLNVNYSDAMSLDIKSAIESHDPNRKPQSPKQIETFIVKHGLANDAMLTMLLSRLKEEGELHGIEKYSLTFFKEVQNALSIAANINYKMFNDNLDFSREKNSVKTFTKTIEINFG